MLYNSFAFLLFFPTVTLLYYLIPALWKRWYLLVVSYLFYMNWNPAYALLLAFIIGVTYVGGVQIVRRKVKYQQTGGGIICYIVTFFCRIVRF